MFKNSKLYRILFDLEPEELIRMQNVMGAKYSQGGFFRIHRMDELKEVFPGKPLEDIKKENDCKQFSEKADYFYRPKAGKLVSFKTANRLLHISCTEMSRTILQNRDSLGNMEVKAYLEKQQQK